MLERVKLWLKDMWAAEGSFYILGLIVSSLLLGTLNIFLAMNGSGGMIDTLNAIAGGILFLSIGIDLSTLDMKVKTRRLQEARRQRYTEFLHNIMSIQNGTESGQSSPNSQ